MVRSELHLESIRRGLSAGQRHDSRIVDQEIKGLPGAHPLRELGDRCEAGQIETFVAHPCARRFAANPLDSQLPLPIVTTGQNDVRTGAGERQSRLVAETTGGSGDDGRSTALGGNFALCRTSHEPTCSRRREPTLTSGSAGSASWWDGSARYRSRGRRYFGRPRTADRP